MNYNDRIKQWALHEALMENGFMSYYDNLADRAHRPPYERTAQETLADLISALEHKLRMLKDLQKALPIEMPFAADQMLRELINTLRRDRPDKY